MGLLMLALGASAGAATTVVPAPVVLGIAGFTGAGISAVSIASSVMSAAAMAPPLATTAAVPIALLQSASFLGIPLAAQSVISALGSGVLAAIVL